MHKMKIPMSFAQSILESNGLNKLYFSTPRTHTTIHKCGDLFIVFNYAK